MVKLIIEIAVAIVVVFATIGHVTGACGGMAAVPGRNYCEYEGHVIPLGITKKINCKRVDCNDDGSLGVCDIGGRLTVPPQCKVIYNGCYQSAVMRNDPSKRCNGPVGGVGR